MQPILYIVVPCYNEEAVLNETNRRLTDKLERMISSDSISSSSRILYINDGSKDRTWETITELNSLSTYSCGVCLSRNRGHQNALLAGLMVAKDYADIVVSMDADLQDDIEVLDQFVERYKEGAEIVYGVRSSRKKDSAFKRGTAHMFYRLMHSMGVELVSDHADYRLMSRRAIEALERFDEVNLFLRGIVPMIGFKTATVEYERGVRYAGESKYPLHKMILFAIEGITSCSVKPLRMITSIGLLISLISIIMLVRVFLGYFVGDTVTGWPTLMVSLFFLGGFQIFALGIVGEYIGKIYLEVKHRPKYIISNILLK